MSSTIVLQTTGLVAGYERDLPIVRGIDFALGKSELVVILGPNGAGKSTFVKAIAGLVPIHSGNVRIGNVDVARAPAHEIIRSGLAFVPQTENVFATLSIADNLRLAADLLAPSERNRRIDAMYGVFPDLAARSGRRAGALSGGQRQMLAIARALIVQPSVLILDEPSAGLSPKVVSEVFSQLKSIQQTGVAIVLVEQNVKAALAVADRAVILVEGQLRHEGTAAGLVDDPLVAELYLGARRERAEVLA